MQPDRYAVIGDPIGHSLSPVMQDAAFRARGLPATYVRMRVAPDHLPSALQLLRRDFSGFNVTIPHKESVATALDEVTQVVGRLGAVNTVVVSGGRMVGHNTDVPGFLSALSMLASPPFATAVVLGSGGSARAVVAGLRKLSGRILVVSRRPESAASILRIGGEACRVVAAGAREAREAVEASDVLVNATPLGMTPWEDACPLPDRTQLAPTTAVFDLVYGRATPLLRLAANSGCRHQDGLEMLVRQGAESFHLWTGLEAPLEAMRRACIDEQRKVAACSAS